MIFLSDTRLLTLAARLQYLKHFFTKRRLSSPSARLRPSHSPAPPIRLRLPCNPQRSLNSMKNHLHIMTSGLERVSPQLLLYLCSLFLMSCFLIKSGGHDVTDSSNIMASSHLAVQVLKYQLGTQFRPLLHAQPLPVLRFDHLPSSTFLCSQTCFGGDSLRLQKFFRGLGTLRQL